MKELCYFCNEWECPYRKNEVHKNENECDLVWGDCPDLENF